jgi:mRNA interferase RelE/StbE
MKKWVVTLTREAKVQLLAISDQRIQESIRRRISQLEDEPEKQGKPMKKELSGYRSIRAVGQRYRIIYKVEEERVIVLIVALGIRREGDKKDIYERAKRLRQSGFFDL